MSYELTIGVLVVLLAVVLLLLLLQICALVPLRRQLSDLQAQSAAAWKQLRISNDGWNDAVKCGERLIVERDRLFDRCQQLEQFLRDVVAAADDETEQAAKGTVFFPYEDVRKLLNESNQERVEGSRA